jgi:replicative DNA helicase
MTDPTQAEDAIVGAILLTSGAILDDTEINPGDFASTRAAAVVELAHTLRRTGRPVDPVTLADAADQTQKRMLDTMWLHACLQATPSAASAEFYADIVGKEATRRRLRQAAASVADLADTTEDVDAAVDGARALIDGAARIDTSRVAAMGDSIDATLDALEGAQTAYPTPWPSLTRAIIGFEPGRLYTVGARPGVGKTVLGLQVALHLATGGGNVVYASMEMRTHELHLRTLSLDQKIDITRLLRHQLQPSDWEKIARRRDWLGSVPLFVDDRPHLTMPMIRQHARSVARKGKLFGVVVDYLQLVSAPRGQERKSRYEVVSDTSRELKLLANELNVPVVALAQLNRGAEQRGPEQPPKVSDLRDSGAIEQDSDVVILMHRDMSSPEKAHELSMFVGKNRHGPTAVLNFDFYGHYSEIREKGPVIHPPGQYMDRTQQ